jgi:hypothetical protein
VRYLNHCFAIYFKFKLRLRFWKIRCYSAHPAGLRRRSAASHFLGLRVRMPPAAWISVFVGIVCYQVEVSATGRSLVQRSRTDCGVSLCVISRPQA